MFQSFRTVRSSGGRLVYTGRVTRTSFNAWASTSQGLLAIAQQADRIWFAPFGKLSAARRQMWRDLNALARTSSFAADVQREVDAYLERLANLVFGEGLPRMSVELHRIVAVPIVLLNAAAYRGLIKRLSAHRRFQSLAGGDPLREFFLLTVVADLEAAVASAQPSPKRPLDTRHGWVSVGLNRTFVWRVPFEAPDWFGHHYLFEVTRERISRTTRKAIEERVRTLEQSLQMLSKGERADILRRATIAA